MAELVSCFGSLQAEIIRGGIWEGGVYGLGPSPSSVIWKFGISPIQISPTSANRVGYARRRKSLHSAMAWPSFNLVAQYEIHDIDQLRDFCTTQSEAIIARVKTANQCKPWTAYRNCSNHISEPNLSRSTFPPSPKHPCHRRCSSSWPWSKSSSVR